MFEGIAQPIHSLNEMLTGAQQLMFWCKLNDVYVVDIHIVLNSLQA